MLFDGTGAAMEAGYALARGEREKALRFNEVCESAHTLASRVENHRIRAPLVHVVRRLFDGGISAQNALAGLMERPWDPRDTEPDAGVG